MKNKKNPSFHKKVERRFNVLKRACALFLVFTLISSFVPGIAPVVDEAEAASVRDWAWDSSSLPTVTDSDSWGGITPGAPTHNNINAYEVGHVWFSTPRTSYDYTHSGHSATNWGDSAKFTFFCVGAANRDHEYSAMNCSANPTVLELAPITKDMGIFSYKYPSFYDGTARVLSQKPNTSKTVSATLTSSTNTVSLTVPSVWYIGFREDSKVLNAGRYIEAFPESNGVMFAYGWEEALRYYFRNSITVDDCIQYAIDIDQFPFYALNAGEKWKDIKPRTISFQNLPTATISGKTILKANAGTNAKTGVLSSITYQKINGTAKPSVYVHQVTGVSGNSVSATTYLNDPRGTSALSSVTEPGLYYVSVMPELLFPITSISGTTPTLSGETVTSDPKTRCQGYYSNYYVPSASAAAVNGINLSRTSFPGSPEQHIHTERYGEEYILYMKPTSFGTYYVDDNASAALTVSPSSSRFNFYSSTANWTKTAGTKTIQLYTNLKTNAAGSGYNLDTASVTVNKYSVDRADSVTASNSNPARNTPFSGLGLPTTTTVHGVVPSGRATAPSVSGVPIIWDESTWDPTSRATQTVRGTANIAGHTEASRVFNNASPTVTAVITPQQTLPSNVDFPNKTVEYTGSPISHEVTSVVGGTVAGYRYVCDELGYDSTEPPTAIGIYEVTATFNQDPDYDELAPATSILTITKQHQTLPDGLVPELDYATPTSITLKPGPGDGPWEYGIIRGGNPFWQDSPEFTDLTPDTEYDFVIRLKETDIKFASETSNPSTFSTLSCEATNTIGYDTLESNYPTPVTLESNVTHNLGDGTTITYQWYKDGTAIEGATNKTIQLTNVADSGQYYCIATLTKDSFTTDVTSDTVTVTISNGSIIPNLLPENWKDYLIVDPITYGETLSDTHIRLDLDRLSADGYPNADQVSIAYKDPSIVPTVPSSLTGDGTYTLVLTASVVNIEPTQEVEINETDITVNPAPLNIKAKDISITFGDDPVAATYDVTITGFVNGDTATDLTGTMTYTSDYNTQWQNRPESGTADILPGGVSSPNYDITFDTGILTINKKEFSYLVDEAEKVYGNPDPAYSKVFTDGVLEGLPETIQPEIKDLLQSIVITRDPGEDVGTYEFHMPAAESMNFKLSTIGFIVGMGPALTIVPKPVAVDWKTPYPSWTNGSDRTSEVSASYLDINGTPVALDVSITQDEVVVPFQEKGEYLAHAVDTSAGKNNYDPQGLDKILSLKDPNSTENVTFPTASDLFLFDHLVDSILTGGNGGENGKGTYQWKDPDFQVTTLGEQMYDVVFTPSEDDDTDYSSEVGWDPDTNTITRKVLVKVNPLQSVVEDSIVYGNDKTYDGTVSAAVIAADAIKIRPEHDVSLTIKATFEDKNVGDGKKIFVHFELSGPDAGLYVCPEDTIVSGSIRPAPLDITANDAVVQFGDPLGDTGLSAEGFVPGETIAELTGTPVYEYSGYHQWDDVPDESLPITVSGLEAQNYAINYKSGTLTVTKRLVKITPDSNQSKIYDDPDPVFTYKYDLGIVGDLPHGVKDVFDANPITLGRVEGENVGIYPFTCTTNDTRNFTYQVVEGETFKINKRPAELIWVGLDTFYFENGEDQSPFIYTHFPRKDGSLIPIDIKWTKNGTEVDSFTTAGTYTLDADVSPLFNYEISNTHKTVIMGSGDDANNLRFPYAIPILKGDSLRESDLVNGKGEGVFDWTDDTIIPDESGYFPVTFSPVPDFDVSTQPGYDPETNTVTRPVYVEVWDQPYDLPPQDDEIWQQLRDAGLLDKIYDSNSLALLTGTTPFLTRNPATGMYELATDFETEEVIHNRTNLTHEQINLFYRLMYGEKLVPILQMLGNNLLTVDVNGSYENQHAGVDKPLTFHFAVSGECARLINPGKKDTVGTISPAKLLIQANPVHMDEVGEPEGAGVEFPSIHPAGYHLAWEQEGEHWEYGFRGDDTIGTLGGTLDYRFVAYKEDGTEVAYSPRELYAAPFYVIPQGLTSTDYELHFLGSNFNAPNIHPDPGSEFEDWTGRRPDPPIMESNTETSITLKPIPLGQYSLDGGKTWQDPVQFDGLTPSTTYPGKQRIPDPKNPGEYLISDPANLKTKSPDDDPARPNPPQIKDKDETSIEVIPIPDGQYSIDGGKTWQDSPIFDGLTPDTTYEIIQRIPNPKKPDEYLVSDPTTAKTDPSITKPPKPIVETKTHESITLKPIPNGEYSIDGGQTWTKDLVFKGLEPDTPYEFIQRIPDGKGGYLVSDPTTERTDPLPDPSKPPRPVIDDVTDTTISVKPIPDGQYSIDGGNTWQDSPIFEGLDPDTEYDIIQRVPDPNNPGDYIVSDPTHVRTDPAIEKPDKPVVDTKDHTSIALKPIPGGQYSVDGGKTWQDSPVFGGLTPDTEYEFIQRIPDGKGGYLVSDPTTERTDPLPDPSKPPRPIIDDVTDTTISVKPIPDGQYSIDGGKTWQDSPIFTGLNPDTEYEIIQRIPDGTGGWVVSDPTNVKTDPAPDLTKPPKPIIDNVTETTVTVKPIPDGEYSIDGGNTWQKSPIFSGLEPGTEYEIIQRVPDGNGGWVVSDPTQVTTKPLQDPNYTINYPNETIIYDNTQWELFEDSNCTKPIPVGGQVTPGTTIYFKHKGTDAVVSKPVPTRPASPVLRHTDETVDGANDGTILDVTDKMEFSMDGGKTWLPCPNGALRGLPPGTYLVRYKATNSAFASLPTVVEILPGASKPSEDPDLNKAGGNGFNSGYSWGTHIPEKATFGGTEIINPNVPLADVEGCPSAQYVDVDQTQWYHDPVDFTVANNLMIGYTAVEWGPTRDMTRFQALQVLYRLAGSPQGYDLSGIEDIPPTFWAYKAIAWAYNMGLTTGLTHTTFGPDESITYEQFADMFYKFCQLYGISPTPGAAPTSYDETKTQSEYQPAMSAMSAAGIFGVQGAMVISPKDTFVRTTGAQIVTNFCTLYRTQISRIGSMNSLPATYRNPGVLNVRGILYS